MLHVGMLYRWLRLSAAAVVAFLAALGTANACVNISGFIIDVGAAETPAVCENIWWNGISGPGQLFDYQFFVASTGPGSIDFFGFGVPPGLPAGGVPPLVSSNLGPTALGNANLTGVLPVTAQANAIFGANAPPAGWDFDEYVGGGAYFVDWNDQGIGTLPGAAALAVNNNPGSIAANPVAFAGSFGVFNAFSPFGPVPGFGVADPPSADIFIELAAPGNTEDLQILLQASGTQVGPTTYCTAPGQAPIQGESTCLDPMNNPAAIPSVPEPQSIALLAAGLVGLMLATRQARRMARLRAL
jgi:hypothetical protein